MEESPKILYSCYAHISRDGEQFIPNHVFSYIVSGSQEMQVGDQNFHFKAGDFRFFRKNQLCRFEKQPPPGGEFISVSIEMDQDTLRSFSAEHNLHMTNAYTGENTLLLQPKPLLTNYIDSLRPYLHHTGKLNKLLTTLKVKECIMLLLETNPALQDALFVF